MDRDDEPLTTVDVARILGLSRKTIESWRYADEHYGPPAHKVGRRAVRYYRSEVEAWRDQHVRTSPVTRRRTA